MTMISIGWYNIIARGMPAAPLARVVAGAPAEVQLNAYSDERFNGPVELVGRHGLMCGDELERELLPVDAATERGRALLRDGAI